MAGTEQGEFVSEDDIFSAAFSGGTASSPEPEQIEPQAKAEDAPVDDAKADDTSGQPRDESGRFKPKDGATAPAKTEATPAPVVETANTADAQQQTSKEDREGWIPSWRAREISEARKVERDRAEKAEASARTAQQQYEALQRQNAEFQRKIEELSKPKQEPVNLFENPDAFVGTWEQKLAQQQESFQSELRKVRLEQNLAFTAFQHKEEFPKAYEAFVTSVQGGDRALATRVFGSSDPGGAMVAWHRERQVISEIGTDPNAYVQRKLEEALKDPAFLAKAMDAFKSQATGQPIASTPQQTAQPTSRPNLKTQLPPSLRSMPGAAAASDGSGIQHMSEDELFDAATRR